jgi:DNA-3-methyladenine glycosylase
MDIRIKRVYDEPQASDGYRVLVDRIWPRGLSKDAARLDEWAKDVAPSTQLRRWFGHVPERYDEFLRRYHAELDENDAAVHLRELAAQHEPLTLLYSAHDERHNQAVALLAYLQGAH